MLSPDEVAQKKAEIENRRAERKRQKRKNFWTRIFLIIFGLLLMCFAAYYSYNQGASGIQVEPVNQRSGSVVPLDPQYERIHILFLGTDDKGDTASRTDTILLVSLDPDTGEAGILSIPRDTRIYIEERNRWDRVNAVHAYGGPQLTVKEISSFLNVGIDYYLETDFAGFSKIVDTLGGVEIFVERDMKYTDTAQDLYIDLRAGNQILNGDQALQYVRYRDRLGDIALVDPQYDLYGGRVERQRRFIMAVVDEMLQPSTILKLPRLIGQIWDAVETDIPWTTALKLAFAADRFTVDNIATAVVPGNSGLIGGASYWIADMEQLKQTIDWVIYGNPLPLTSEILNGSGVSGVAANLREMLASEAIEIKSVGNADHFNYLVSQVIVSSEEIAERSKWLATLLDAELIVKPERKSQVDVSIIIGRNFQIP